jgi:hypothetical protein
MGQIGSIGLAFGLALVAGFLMWISRAQVRWGREWFMIGCHVGALVFAVGAGIALRRTWLGSTALADLATLGPWVPWLYGLAACLIPVALVVALIPGLPLAVNEGLVLLAALLVPLSAYSFTSGWVPSLGRTITDAAVRLAANLTGGAF